VADSAARQGISTESGWQHLSVVSKRLLYISRGCGRPPASYLVNAINPEDLNLATGAAVDQFVRDFVHADESKRNEMLSVQ
jgi:hypothetical protein